MSGVLISDYQIGTPKWSALLASIEKARKGYLGLSLTNYDNNSLPAIAAGSNLEISGALYGFTAEEAIGGTPSSGNINYIYINPTPITATWTTTAPVWSDAKNGWYDAGESNRYIGGCYYDGTKYQQKWIYGDKQVQKPNDVPIGFIGAWIAGYFTNEYNGGFTAVTIALTDSWKECDGSALNDPESPIYNAAGRYLPNLTDDRFLMGNTVAGEIGGNNEMPHYHTGPSHIHDQGNLVALITMEIGVNGIVNFAVTRSYTPNTSMLCGGAAYSSSEEQTLSTYVAGDTGASGTGNTGPASNTQNRPKYLSCKYVQRVK